MESNPHNNNQELRRLEKKAKTGWAAFYRSQRDLHDVIDSYIVDVRSENCLIQIKSQPNPKCAICRRKLF